MFWCAAISLLLELRIERQNRVSHWVCSGFPVPLPPLPQNILEGGVRSSLRPSNRFHRVSVGSTSVDGA